MSEGRSRAKRRKLLAIGGAVAAGAVGGGFALRALFPQWSAQWSEESGEHPHRAPPANSAGPRLTKFVDALPIPSTLTTSRTLNGLPYYEVKMSALRQKLHRDLPATGLWGYNGQAPAPTFEVRRGRAIAVKWENDLPDAHFLPIDPMIHGAEPPAPPVRTVVHLHGAVTMPASDGYPDAWFTRGFAQTGAFFAGQVYHYPNEQEAATLWYHDHALGITRLNVYAGLAGGLYLIRDDREDALGLPRGRYEIPLVIQDRYVGEDGALLYPVQTPGDPDARVPTVWLPEFFGDTVLVNGKIWPFLEVEPRKYRFRILNGANARFFRLTLQESAATGERLRSSGPVPDFIQIGSDGGLLPAPVKRSRLLIAPAERLDVVIDFAAFAGETFVLANDAPAPFPDGEEFVPPDVMLFKVSLPLQEKDASKVPAARAGAAPLSPSRAVKTRDIVLGEIKSEADNPIMATINDAHWNDAVTESPRAGAVEIWRFINATGDAHPMHVHLVQFQVLDRQPFDVEQYPGKLVFTAPPSPPEDNERAAWKDTVISYPGQVVRIIAKFDLPGGADPRPGQKFRYVYHCHILEHEDNEMMRPYEVVA
jgi:spore coat protein A